MISFAALADRLNRIAIDPRQQAETNVKNMTGKIQFVIDKPGNIPGMWGISKEWIRDAKAIVEQAKKQEVDASGLAKLIPVAEKHVQIRENMTEIFDRVYELKKTDKPLTPADEKYLATAEAHAKRNQGHETYGKHFKNLLLEIEELRAAKQPAAQEA